MSDTDILIDIRDNIRELNKHLKPIAEALATANKLKAVELRLANGGDVSAEESTSIKDFVDRFILT